MITGTIMRNAVICASERMTADRHIIDALNVFPVPDGDTGTNMSMTMSAAAKELCSVTDDASVSAVVDRTAAALLRGARGNSGVILSLIFGGFTKGLKDCVTADGTDIARALEWGTSSAYQAVSQPTEGTILTVIRHATEAAKQHAEYENDPVAVMEAALNGAKSALADTPNLLPVLKKAGVVDAGGQGLVVIFESMLAAFKGEEVDVQLVTTTQTAEEHRSALAVIGDADIPFTYCTELIVQRKADLDPDSLRGYLVGMGDSLVFVADDDIIKVHVHTDEPLQVVQMSMEFGTLVNIKIENMRHQHTHALALAQEMPSVAMPEKAFGMVAVAAGAGQEDLFRQLGVDALVQGGQTMNPSTDEILKVIQAVPAEHVFVFPNNKNIIMAAEQTVGLCDKTVHVIPTQSIPQGIAAALMLQEDVDAQENAQLMLEAAQQVDTGLVTYAARDSVVEGKPIRRGEFLGLENGDITVVANDAQEAAYQVTQNLLRETSSCVTILTGMDVQPEETERLQTQLAQLLPAGVELAMLPGGQPVYAYIIAVE